MGFFLIEFLSLALSVSELLSQEKKNTQIQIHESVLINYLPNKIAA